MTTGKSVAIMQPYFLPYIGYFQLIASVNEFVVYDNIKYTKKGWINRNRFLSNARDETFSLPLQKDSDQLFVCERKLAESFNRKKLLNQIHGAYAKAPHFSSVFPVFERIIEFQDRNLFWFIYNSLLEICEYIGLDTRFKVSSKISIDHELKSAQKVIAICKATKAQKYVNPIGGLDLYRTDMFLAEGIELQFLKSRNIEYSQFGEKFVPWLSIIDVLMFNSREAAKLLITREYDVAQIIPEKARTAC